MAFKIILKFEYKKAFTGRNIIIFSILFLLVSSFSWEGINDYKILLESKTTFQEMENDKIPKYINITLYGVRGIRLLFMPSPMNIFFNNLAIFKSIVANINSTERLNIKYSLKGKELFDQSNNYTDFAGLSLLIGGLFGLLYGFLATHKNQYLKFLKDISGDHQIIFALLFSRIFILVISVLLFLGIYQIWLIALGFNTINLYFILFSFELTISIVIFFLIGALCGFLKKIIKKYSTPFIIFFLLIFIIPWTINKIVYIDAAKNLQSIHEFEYDGFKIIMDLEKRLNKRFGIFKSGKPAPKEIQKAVKESLEMEHKKIRELEENRLIKISKRVNLYQTLSAFFPTTFCFSINREISSNGFQAFLEFYKYACKMKYEFIKFFINRKFEKPAPSNKLESFIKGDENIFNGKSSLPHTFWWGNGLMFVYIFFLLFLIHRVYSENLKKEIAEKLEIEFNEANSLFLLCENAQVKSDIFSYYQNGDQAICIDRFNIDHLDDSIKPTVFFKYLCRLARVDEDKARNYLSMIKGDLNGKLCPDLAQKIYFCVKCSKESQLYVINDFFKKKSLLFEKDFKPLLNHLNKEGKILYLGIEPYIIINGINDYLSQPDENKEKYKLSFLPSWDKVTLK